MTRDECVELLAVIISLDRRTIGATDVTAWMGTVGDLRFAECRDAAVAHFQTSTEWLMPVHVRRRVTASRQDNAMRTLPESWTDRVPMPDWFRSTVAEIGSRQRALNAARREAGEPAIFGDAIITAFDGRPTMPR